MARSSNSYRRAPARFRAQPTILVICEDEKSGRHYLQDASQFFRADVHFEITHCGHTDPLGIVQAAWKRALRFDSVYCVIDRDSHHNFAEAIKLAGKSEKIKIIASYPCFEYWLLLHFNESRKPYAATGNKSAADVLISDLSACEGMSAYQKGSTHGLFKSLLGARFEAAKLRSPRVLADAIRVQEMNPSTRLHELMKVIEELGTPQLISN